MRSSTPLSDLSSDFGIIETPQIALRRIEISYRLFNYHFHVPPSLYHHALKIRNRLLRSLEEQPDSGPSSLEELVSRYIDNATESRDQWADAWSTTQPDLIALLLEKFESDFLRGADIHSVAATLPGNAEERQSVVRSILTAMAYIGRSPVADSALFRSSSEDNRPRLYAVFGGQGNTTDYLSELREIYTTYGALIASLISVADDVLKHLSEKAMASGSNLFHRGLDIKQWLECPETTPESDYLIAAPISVPLIGLAQMAQYAVMCRTMGKTPGDLTQRFEGLAGHSQGLVVAIAIATSNDWDSFELAARKALNILFVIGFQAQEHTPSIMLPPKISAKSVEQGDGMPTSMLSVSDCTKEQLQNLIEIFNKGLAPHERVHIGLINGRSNQVVSGPALSLCALSSTIKGISVAPNNDQSRIPFSSRKSGYTTKFLPITAPFHTLHLEHACADALKELEHVHVYGASLLTSVYDGQNNLRDCLSTNIVPILVRAVLTEMVDWPHSTVFQNATHILDFGPGGLSGVGALTQQSKDGTGARLIVMNMFDGPSTRYGYRPEIYNSNARSIRWGCHWKKEYGLHLSRSKDGRLRMENRMTKLLGLPPVMVAGMTPTTSSWEFASSIANAGYHVELAAGGLHNADKLSQAILKLQMSIPKGRGICINLIYANPSAIRWQIPLIRKLRSEGVPIDGITFGAGVPSLEIAGEYISSLNLRYISFKPGSVTSINQTISIAQANPHFPIMLQWTGGRGGGHHSYEDFHEPIIRLYGQIRRCENIVLIAGSGFGGGDDTYPYMTGEWSSKMGYPAMPFDGCLLGSRVMVAKEAFTSRAAKEAIVAAPGIVDQSTWEQTYKRPTGGIVTVRSEMGEPIHKLATRGVLLWKEMDDQIFSITDKNKRLSELQKRKAYIIGRLNHDFQKVWFGRDNSGKAVDLEEMTYAEILHRLIELLYVKTQSRWIDSSYLELTVQFVRRLRSRCRAAKDTWSFNKRFGLHDPIPAVQRILDASPEAKSRLVAFEDAKYFVLLCKKPGQKPVTFVPALDDDFEHWFKKDSLWQSEDLEAVVDQDAQRTCILQGPVAATYSTIVDEPVGEILDQISTFHIKRLLEEKYGGDLASIPMAGTLQHQNMADQHLCPPSVRVWYEGSNINYRINSDTSEEALPDAGSWFKLIAGMEGTWVHALLTSKDLVQGSTIRPNPLRRIFAPANGLHIVISHAENAQKSEIWICEENSSDSVRLRPSVLITQLEGEISLTLSTTETRGASLLQLVFKYTYQPECVLHPIWEITDGKAERLRRFYYRLWFGKPLQSELDENCSSPEELAFYGSETKISSSDIRAFTRTVQQFQKSSPPLSKTLAPLDFAMVVGWEAMMKAIFTRSINGNFLDLVHLSNRFKVLDDSAPLRASDHVESSAKIMSIMNESPGRVVKVLATIYREGIPVLELESEFLFRGKYVDFDVCFQKQTVPHMKLLLDTPAKVAILRAKDWILDLDSTFSLLGKNLIFDIQSIARYSSASRLRSVEVNGFVLAEDIATRSKRVVATVFYKAECPSENVVMEYLQRHGTPVEETHTLTNMQTLGDDAWLQITAPQSNRPYAEVSGDYNPIHVSGPFAAYADLPGTITHGMFTSAAVRQLVERAAGTSEQYVRMRSYKTSFVGMILPGDVIKVQVQQIAMRRGLRVLSFEAVNVKTEAKVLTGEAEIDQAPTAYVFTGQGSQKLDMGMTLYAESKVARQVWDEADRFFSETYGKSKQSSCSGITLADCFLFRILLQRHSQT